MWITLGMFFLKKALLPLIVIAVILFFIVKLKGGCRPNKTLRGRAVSVQDGDTITFRARLKRRTVHLKGVDCPELGQPYGAEAKAYTEQLLKMGERFRRRPRVKLVLVRKDQKWATVEGPEGWELNRELVRYGLAWAVDKGYNEVERAARKAKRGLWADKHPVPPWEWVEGTSTLPPPWSPPGEWVIWWEGHKEVCRECAEPVGAMCVEAFLKLQDAIRKEGEAK